MDIKGCLTSNSQNWSTPLELYRVIVRCGLVDICPLNCDRDCFQLDNWFKRTYCNPPYNNILAFIERGIIEMKKGNSILYLIPSRTDTQWFKKLYENNASFYFIEGWLHFNDSKSAPFPSMIAILNRENEIPTFSYIKKGDIIMTLGMICTFLV